MGTDRIYGDWEQRIAERVRPVRWSGILRQFLLVTLTIGLSIVAQFGFR